MSDERHVVLVDDNLDMLDLFADLVQYAARELGIAARATTFPNGKFFLEAVTDGGLTKADLILLDYDMPGMTGDEVCQKLRELGIDSIVVFLSAYRDKLRKEVARAAGADAYSEKAVISNVGVQFTTLIRIARDRALPDSPPDWLTVF